MDNAVILLSSFNGEKYIREQLDSLFSQTGVEIHIVVRDDGSSDSTLSIIYDYKKKYPSFIEVIEGKNIGWKKSFLSLIDYARVNFPDSNYFAFCDQDDVWMPDKLSVAINSLSDLSDRPALYCSSLYAWDGRNIRNMILRNVAATPKNALARNYATGCTVVFNRPLLQLLAIGKPSHAVPHDHWAYMVAATCGTVITDPVPHILYRQHEANQIGNKTSLLDIWRRRIRNFRDPEANHFRENSAKELLRLYHDLMSKEGREATEKIASYKHSLANRLRLLFDNGYTLGNPANDLFFKLRVISGLL